MPVVPFVPGTLGIQEEQYTLLGQISDASGNPIVSTELVNLPNSGIVLSSVIGGSGYFANYGTYGGFVSGSANGNGSALFRMHLHANFTSGAAAANTVVDGWFLCRPDSFTSMETGSSGIAPSRAVDFSFPVGGFSGVDVEQVAVAPVCSYLIQTLVRNNATGSSIGSGSYIKCYTQPRLIIGPCVPSTNYP